MRKVDMKEKELKDEQIEKQNPPKYGEKLSLQIIMIFKFSKSLIFSISIY